MICPMCEYLHQPSLPFVLLLVSICGGGRTNKGFLGAGKLRTRDDGPEKGRGDGWGFVRAEVAEQGSSRGGGAGPPLEGREKRERVLTPL